MNRYAILSVCAMMATATPAAMASTPGYYFSGLAGASLLPSLGYKDSTGLKTSADFDDGYVFGGAFGYDTGNGWRYEVDSLYQLSGIDSFGASPSTGHLSSSSLMFNTTFDLTQNTLFTPYLGAGIGLQDAGGEINGFSGHRWKPAYQLEGGLRYDISPDVSLFGEYRFSQSEAARLSDANAIADQHFSDHALMVGVTYHLGGD